jgi:hypothetical protein
MTSACSRCARPLSGRAPRQAGQLLLGEHRVACFWHTSLLRLELLRSPSNPYRTIPYHGRNPTAHPATLVAGLILAVPRPPFPRPQDIQRFYNTVIEELPSNVADLI